MQRKIGFYNVPIKLNSQKETNLRRVWTSEWDIIWLSRGYRVKHTRYEAPSRASNEYSNNSNIRIFPPFERICHIRIYIFPYSFTHIPIKYVQNDKWADTLPPKMYLKILTDVIFHVLSHLLGRTCGKMSHIRIYSIFEYKTEWIRHIRISEKAIFVGRSTQVEVPQQHRKGKLRKW